MRLSGGGGTIEYQEQEGLYRKSVSSLLQTVDDDDLALEIRQQQQALAALQKEAARRTSIDRSLASTLPVVSEENTVVYVTSDAPAAPVTASLEGVEFSRLADIRSRTQVSDQALVRMLTQRPVSGGNK